MITMLTINSDKRSVDHKSNEDKSNIMTREIEHYVRSTVAHSLDL